MTTRGRLLFHLEFQVRLSIYDEIFGMMLVFDCCNCFVFGFEECWNMYDLLFKNIQLPYTGIS